MIGNEVSGMQALTVTVFSMGLVFLTLFAISLILDIFKVQNQRDQKKQSKKAEENKAQKKPDQGKPAITQQEDDGEIIAVITAALAASLNTQKDKLIIKNIRQIQDPTWAQMGR